MPRSPDRPHGRTHRRDRDPHAPPPAMHRDRREQLRATSPVAKRLPLGAASPNVSSQPARRPTLTIEGAPSFGPTGMQNIHSFRKTPCSQECLATEEGECDSCQQKGRVADSLAAKLRQLLSPTQFAGSFFLTF